MRIKNFWAIGWSGRFHHNLLDVNFTLTFRSRTGEKAQGVQSKFKLWGGTN